ncbi:MAG: DUF1616 domain-containing protein [Candidatus Bathyarchaeota archaeon]|nr:DUF1616 domain-containing protein [Candidatus Bathyarchaeota archaeon]
MKRLSEVKRKIAELMELDSKGHKIAVALALIFVCSLFLGYYYVSRLPPEGYNTIYLLDYEHKKAIEYPETLVITISGEVKTFNLWVVVENHMGSNQSYQVLQKVVKNQILSIPVDAEAEKSYSKTLGNGESWETLATVSLNQTGSYSVIFELWIYDSEAEAFKFSYNYCVLNIDVIA